MAVDSGDGGTPGVPDRRCPRPLSPSSSVPVHPQILPSPLLRRSEISFKSYSLLSFSDQKKRNRLIFQSASITLSSKPRLSKYKVALRTSRCTEAWEVWELSCDRMHWSCEPKLPGLLRLMIYAQNQLDEKAAYPHISNLSTATVKDPA